MTDGSVTGVVRPTLDRETANAAETRPQASESGLRDLEARYRLRNSCLTHRNNA